MFRNIKRVKHMKLKLLGGWLLWIRLKISQVILHSSVNQQEIHKKRVPKYDFNKL